MTLKEKVKKLESELDEAKRKAANLILNTEDNVFTKDELKKIKFLEAWAFLGPCVGIGLGLLF
tara:strand:- start:1464 stop:1652 length:189 start_codon:yes stop_codon:yes gene_type:complete